MVSFSRNFVCTFLSLALLLASSSTVQGFSSPSPNKIPSKTNQISQESTVEGIGKWVAQGMLLGCLAVPQIASAVSGGGLDYANLDISNQDFSNGNYKGKDFTQVSQS